MKYQCVKGIRYLDNLTIVPYNESFDSSKGELYKTQGAYQGIKTKGYFLIEQLDNNKVNIINQVDEQDTRENP